MKRDHFLYRFSKNTKRSKFKVKLTLTKYFEKLNRFKRVSNCLEVYKWQMKFGLSNLVT